MSYSKIRIYGSDVDYSTNDFSVSKTILDSAAVPYIDINVAAIDGHPIRETEMIDYFGNIRKQTVVVRYGANPQSVAMPFESATNYDSFWSTDVFNKNYNYLFFDSTILDYKLKPANLSATDCLCINIPELEPVANHEQGVKYLNLTIETRK